MAFADRLVGRSRVPAQALSTGQPTTSEIAGSADWAGERSGGLGEPLATSTEVCEVRAGRGVLCIVRKTKLPLTRPTLVALGSATLSRKGRGKTSMRLGQTIRAGTCSSEEFFPAKSKLPKSCSE